MKFNLFSSLLIKIILIGYSFFMLSSCNNDGSKETSASKDTITKQEQNSPASDACKLLTEADARSILGDKLKPGMHTATMCQYISDADELARAGESVSLTIHENAASEFAKYIADTESSTSTKTETVNGIGKNAAWADGSLIVEQGNDLLVIVVGKKLPKEEHIALAKSLANKIISRL
jgi:hypothetical protein